MTYNEAYSKIIDAYFRDEIRAMDSNFCFCGTLTDAERAHKFYSHLERLVYSN